ncbi:hypothetical protein ACYSNX_12640 [Myroides sp. LJL115]
MGIDYSRKKNPVSKPWGLSPKAWKQEMTQFMLHSQNSSLKNIGTLRYTKAQIFYYWLSLKKRGIDYDINKDIYTQTKDMQLQDLVNFFDNHVKAKTYNVGLMGKKEELDWQSVQKLGKVIEVSLEELFGY